MKQDEIIEMAKQAGLAHFYDSEGHCTGITDDDLITADKEKNDARLVEMLMPFSKLVAAKEREACAQTCENLPIPDEYSDSEGSMWDVAAIECAEAIRARGEA